MGGNLINYPEDVGTPTANLLLIKIFLNSVILTRGAKFAGADLANFYLVTPLKRPEYAKIKLSDIPEEVIKEYNLHQYATPDGWVYIKVSRGMYGLPQAGSLSHDLLEQRLNKEGYFQSQIVPALWKHSTKPIQFVLEVDDFGIKYHFLSENVASPSRPSTTKLRSSKQSCHPPPKPRLVHYTQCTQRGRRAKYLRVLGHPQPPTPVQTDNSTAEGIIHL